jgi:MFS family permease
LNPEAAEVERPSIPGTVIALGFVSLFMDVSSEIIHALLPLFLTTTLGVSVALVGVIDGIAEATAAITKVFSGYVSDRIGRRRPLIILGYGMAALTKPLFAMAQGAGLILAARFADRIGKGLRGAPRDALVADVTPEAFRGRAFGLRQSMDTIGAFLGPLSAIGLMFVFHDNMRNVFWIAVIPAFLSALVAIVWIHEPAEQLRAHPRAPIRFDEVGQLGSGFWAVVAVGLAFTLARFSEAFLVLVASKEGLPLAFAPLVLVMMNAIYALGAYPAGILADHLPARILLHWGLLCLIAADAVLALSSGLTMVFAGIALWGAHMALTQGLLAKLVADRSPSPLRGTAFGFFNFVTGLGTLASSVAAGVLWEWSGPVATFIAGGTLGLISLLLSVGLLPDRTHDQ